MQEINTINYAGDLFEEMEEVENMILQYEDIELYGSKTFPCGAFFTIYCC